MSRKIVDLPKIPETKALEAEAIYDNLHYAQFKGKESYGNLEIIPTNKSVEEKIYGGIVSHHLVAAQEIAKFFINLKKQNPETILILGPNHFGLGSNVFVSKYPYKTPWGVVEPDTENINKLIQSGFVDNNEKPFEMEHSISSLVSYIAYVFPNAKIIPIIFTKYIPQDRLELLSNELDQILPDNTLAIASVDFSHHLNRIAANFHDKESVSSIASFNFDNIYNLEIDSPASIFVLLKYLEGRGAKKMSYANNVNSANLFSEFDSEDVTSYLFSYFTEGSSIGDEKITILNFGDSMFDRGVESNVFDKGKEPFEHIKGTEGNFLKGADFIILNLEGPITDYDSCSKKELSFKFKPEVANLLFENNINMANLANNHIFDCFNKGIEDTKNYLKELDISYFGGLNLEDSYTVKKISNKKVAFVGIDQTIEPVTLDSFYPLINKLKKENDYVVINIHWGYEYNNLSSKKQKDIAYKLIDNGADVIFGHHPHVIQPIEIYKNKVIFYSLGNFIFDQLTKPTNEGVGVGIVLDEEQYDFYLFPYDIVNSQPVLLSYKDAVFFCNEFLKDINQKNDCMFTIWQ